MRDGAPRIAQCLFERGIVRGMRDEHRRLVGLRWAVEQTGSPMSTDASNSDRHAGRRLAEILERREHRVYTVGKVAVLHHHRDAVKPSDTCVRRDSRSVAAQDEIFRGTFTRMERLIACKFEI